MTRGMRNDSSFSLIIGTNQNWMNPGVETSKLPKVEAKGIIQHDIKTLMAWFLMF